MTALRKAEISEIQAEPVVRPAPKMTVVASAPLAPMDAGWATRHPDDAMRLLFVNPQDGVIVDALLALNKK